MMPKLHKGATANNSLGFNAGTDTLRWFYADELLYRPLSNVPLVKYSRTPLTGLHECSEHLYTMCREHPGKSSTWTMTI